MTRVLINEVPVDLPSPYGVYEADNPDSSEYGRRNYRETGYMSASEELSATGASTSCTPVTSPPALRSARNDGANDTRCPSASANVWSVTEAMLAGIAALGRPED